MDELDFSLAVIIVSAMIAVVWILAYQWRRVRVAAYNARLKQLMIERGMSAAEVERILAADGALENDKARRCDRRNDSL